MPFNADASYSVFTKARPYRTAFLIDPQKTTDELLDAIYDFNLEQWGGRYNPIIPVVDGKISSAYFSLLSFCDPDVVYTYVPLLEGTVSEIDRRIGPSTFVQHRERTDADGKVRYAVMEHHGVQPNIEYCISRFSDRFRIAPSSVLTCHEPWKCRDYHLVQRNFGAYNDNVLGRELPQGVGAYKIEESSGLVSALVAKSALGGVIFPILFSTLDSGPPEIDRADRNDAYHIVFGTDVWSWLRVWNRIFYLPGWKRQQLTQICLPASFVQNQHGLDVLKSFMPTFAHRMGNYSPVVMFESYDLTQEQLLELAKALTHRVDATPHARRLEGEEITEIKHEPSFRFRQSRWKHFHFQGNKAFVPIDVPPIVSQRSGQSNWVMDMKIEYRPEQFAYTNQTYWWRLPKKNRLARLFFTDRSSRITKDGSLSVAVSGQDENSILPGDDRGQHVELHIPVDDLNVFGMIYRIEEIPHYSADIRGRSDRPYGGMVLSDKGKYARGYLQLFSSLFHASHIWENRFWRGTLEWLCSRGPEQDATAEERVRNTIRKKLDVLKTQLTQNVEVPLSWLTRFILREARSAPLIIPEVTFEQLLSRLNKERTHFKESNPQHKDFQIDEHTNRADLRDALSSLTEGSIFFQGIKPKCRSCGSTAWFSCEEIAQALKCSGCRAEIPLPVEPTWVYRLNELIVKAIAFHGVFPVIWTLGYLLGQSRESFLFIPSVELYEKHEDKERVAEVDITCVSDGKLLVGEVKTSADEFDGDEIDALEAVCRKILPDVAVLSAFTGNKARLNGYAEDLRARLTDLKIDVLILMPPEYMSDPEYHITI